MLGRLMTEIHVKWTRSKDPLSLRPDLLAFGVDIRTVLLDVLLNMVPATFVRKEVTLQKCVEK